MMVASWNMPCRARNRECLAWWTAAALLLAVFGAVPELDIWVSRRVHAGGGEFPLAQLAWVQGLYHLTPWVGRGLFVVSLVILAVAAIRVPVSRRIWRRAGALALVLLLGLGGVVHGLFKENWGRPRPHQVQEFAGSRSYVPALRPGGECSRNCSFVSGHAATGFGLIALGLFSCRARRRTWFLIAMSTGLMVGAGRVLQGGHFLSDVLFAGLIMWGVAMATRAVWLRIVCWRRPPLTDRETDGFRPPSPPAQCKGPH